MAKLIHFRNKCRQKYALYRKRLQIKVLEHSISYEKVSGRICPSTIRGKVEAPKMVIFEIRKCTKNYFGQVQTFVRCNFRALISMRSLWFIWSKYGTYSCRVVQNNSKEFGISNLCELAYEIRLVLLESSSWPLSVNCLYLPMEAGEDRWMIILGRMNVFCIVQSQSKHRAMNSVVFICVVLVAKNNILYHTHRFFTSV